MTHPPDPAPSLGALTRRSGMELARQQVEAIAAFTRAKQMAQDAAAATARSREMRMDAARRLEIVRRQHAAVIARTHEHLRLSGKTLMHTAASCRVVLVHRDEWFRTKVAASLDQPGWTVVGSLDNGADAIGLSVAEQPDILLVGDKVTMVPPDTVVREVRRFCPPTLIAAQAPDLASVGALLDAGASKILTRLTAGPAEVAARLLTIA